jgi:hypothetical protein
VILRPLSLSLTTSVAPLSSEGDSSQPDAAQGSRGPVSKFILLFQNFQILNLNSFGLAPSPLCRDSGPARSGRRQVAIWAVLCRTQSGEGRLPNPALGVRGNYAETTLGFRGLVRPWELPETKHLPVHTSERSVG